MTRNNARLGDPPAHQGRKRLGMILGGLAVLTISLAIRYYWGAEQASAGPARSSAPRNGHSPSAAKSHDSSKPKVVAVVNRERITRDELGRECLRHYGETVLDNMVNKFLIFEECKRRNIVVMRDDVNAEIARMAKQFSLPTEQLLKVLKEKHGISAAQYGSDIIKPMLALRQLAGDTLVISPKDLVKEYDTMYGPAIDARLIACRRAEAGR